MPAKTRWPSKTKRPRCPKLIRHRGQGRVGNPPLPACAGGVAWPPLLENLPQSISAGFDAQRADPLADLALSSGDFAELARMVAGFAPRPGRLVLFLEGGYDLGALRMSVAATLGALLGDTYQPEDSTCGGPGAEMVDQARAERDGALQRAGPLAPSERRIR